MTGRSSAIVLVSMTGCGSIGTLPFAGDVGEGGQTLVSALEQLIAGTGGGGIGSRRVSGQGATTIMLARTMGSRTVSTVSMTTVSVSTVSMSAMSMTMGLRALAVTLLILVDKVFLCWRLDHIDEHGLNLNATWVVLNVDLAEDDCWGLVEHHGGRLHHQWGMVDQHLGGRTLDNDGSGTMDKDLALVLRVGDR